MHVALERDPRLAHARGDEQADERAEDGERPAVDEDEANLRDRVLHLDFDQLSLDVRHLAYEIERTLIER